MQVTPIAVSPELVLVDRPTFPDSLLAQAAKLRTELLALPDGYDDPILVCLEGDVERALVYEADYSLARTVHATQNPRFGLGALAAKLLIEGGDGREWLWQLRSEQVLGPSLWSWSAAGAVDPGESPLQAVRREAQEELGIAASALEQLKPLALLNGRGLSVLFRARLRPGVELYPNANEVAELRFAASPPAPRTATVAAVWAKVRALL